MLDVPVRGYFSLRGPVCGFVVFCPGFRSPLSYLLCFIIVSVIVFNCFTDDEEDLVADRKSICILDLHQK